MKRLCFSRRADGAQLPRSSAYAGPFDFVQAVGSHRVHIESSRHCRSVSCASMSISRRLNWRHRRDRYEGERDARLCRQSLRRSAPQTISPPAAAVDHGAGQGHRCRPAAGHLHGAPHREARSSLRLRPARAAASPGAYHRFQRRRSPPVEKPVETAQPAPQVERVSHQAEDEPSDSPIGDWQTEGKGTVRIAKMRQCASAALCSVHRTRRAKRS